MSATTASLIATIKAEIEEMSATTASLIAALRARKFNPEQQKQLHPLEQQLSFFFEKIRLLDAELEAKIEAGKFDQEQQDLLRQLLSSFLEAIRLLNAEIEKALLQHKQQQLPVVVLQQKQLLSVTFEIVQGVLGFPNTKSPLNSYSNIEERRSKGVLKGWKRENRLRHTKRCKYF